MHFLHIRPQLGLVGGFFFLNILQKILQVKILTLYLLKIGRYGK